MTKNRFLWCITILSALAYSVAFLGPACAGWLAVPAVGLLGWHRVDAVQAFVWGLLAFGLHSLWILQVLLMHTLCSGWLCVAVFTPLVLLGGLIAAGWWGAMQTAARCVSPRMRGVARGVATLIVWWWLCSLYPFINPLIPLAQYRWFLRSLALVFGAWHGYTLPPSLPTALNESIGYIRPVINRAMDSVPAWAHDPYAVGQRLNDQIQKSAKPLLVSPESTFTFPLIDHENIGKSFFNTKNDQQVVLMGSGMKKADGVRHAVYCLQGGLIIDFYVKKSLLPFAEQTPLWLSWMTPFLQRISRGAWADSLPGALAEGAEIFEVGLPFKIRPRICWEFFAGDWDYERTSVLFAFINDSWFTPYARKNMLLTAVLKSHCHQRLVVYIGHFGCYTINPYTSTITSLRS